MVVDLGTSLETEDEGGEECGHRHQGDHIPPTRGTVRDPHLGGLTLAGGWGTDLHLPGDKDGSVTHVNSQHITGGGCVFCGNTATKNNFKIPAVTFNAGFKYLCECCVWLTWMSVSG